MTQGMITSVLLLFSQKNKVSNRFLALGLMAFCLMSTKILLLTTGLWYTKVFRYFPLGVDLAIPPLLYFYMSALMTPNFTWQTRYWVYFIPFLLSEVYSIAVYVNVVALDVLSAKDLVAHAFRFNQIKAIEDYLTLIAVIICITLGFTKLQNYRQWLHENTADTSYPTFQWLRNIYALLSLLGVLMVVNFTLDHILGLHQYHFVRWQLFYLLVAFIIYYLGFVGYRQPQYYLPTITKTTRKHHEILPSQKQQVLLQKIEQALQEDKVFLDPKINLKELATKLEIDSTSLSQVINQSYQKNFRNLMNEYRIEEVKQKLLDKDYEHLSILGVALECGFNSEASFYRIFKKFANMSPLEYKNQAKKAT